MLFYKAVNMAVDMPVNINESLVNLWTDFMVYLWQCKSQ